MKALFLIAISILYFSLSAKSDTIDYWHIYYNGVKIGEWNRSKIHQIDLKLRKIQKKDSITVKYFRDTPCFNCETILDIEDDEGIQVLKATGKGTLDPIKFAIKDISRNTKRRKYLKVYLREESQKHALQKLLLFYVRIER